MKLSKKLHLAILQALNDLELCMADPDYQIDFGKWHTPNTVKQQFERSPKFLVCSVCFAGAVIAKTLKGKKTSRKNPSDFDTSTENMLYSLDSIREGRINQALLNLGLNLKKPFKDVKVNQKNFDKFKIQMLKISELLKKEDL